MAGRGGLLSEPPCAAADGGILTRPPRRDETEAFSTYVVPPRLAEPGREEGQLRHLHTILARVVKCERTGGTSWTGRHPVLGRSSLTSGNTTRRHRPAAVVAILQALVVRRSQLRRTNLDRTSFGTKRPSVQLLSVCEGAWTLVDSLVCLEASPSLRAALVPAGWQASPVGGLSPAHSVEQILARSDTHSRFRFGNWAARLSSHSCSVITVPS